LKLIIKLFSKKIIICITLIVLHTFILYNPVMKYKFTINGKYKYIKNKLIKGYVSIKLIMILNGLLNIELIVINMK
jgi:hypothetical protein